MSTLTLAVLALVLLIGPALVVLVLVLDASDIWGTESYTISTRDLPNTAPGLTGTADRPSDTSTETRQ